MRMKGCLIALGAALAVAATALALVGPALVREGRRLYAPISRMKTAGEDFEKWVREHPWEEPATPTLAEDQVARFLGLRRELQRVTEETDSRTASFAKREKPTLRDVPAIAEGVGGLVAEELKAFRRAGMTPAEYRYLDRLIYRSWLGGLRSQGADPAASEAAAREIEKAAAAEHDPKLARELRRVADETRQKKPPAPEGVPPGIHSLLLARASEIQALTESPTPLVLQRRH